jgi:D-glycero-D-manno-heptose 1,7-bisphosphate phosphatase
VSRPHFAFSSRRAVFLDRDGVINRAFLRDGVTRPPCGLDELELLPGVEAATRRLSGLQLRLIVVTNQPDVARGTQPREAVEAIHRSLRDSLPLDDVAVCYHDDGDGCHCRKPKPGMLIDAAERHGVDLASSFLVGDRWSDIAAGEAAGCRTVLVDGPDSRPDRCRPDARAAGLPEAAEWIARAIASEVQARPSARAVGPHWTRPNRPAWEPRACAGSPN